MWPSTRARRATLPTVDYDRPTRRTAKPVSASKHAASRLFQSLLVVSGGGQEARIRPLQRESRRSCRHGFWHQKRHCPSFWTLWPRFERPAGQTSSSSSSIIMLAWSASVLHHQLWIHGPARPERLAIDNSSKIPDYNQEGAGAQRGPVRRHSDRASEQLEELRTTHRGALKWQSGPMGTSRHGAPGDSAAARDTKRVWTYYGLAQPRSAQCPTPASPSIPFLGVPSAYPIWVSSSPCSVSSVDTVLALVCHPVAV